MERGKGGIVSRIKNQVQIFEKNAKHIFRNAPGHLMDTPENRRLLIDLVSDPKNYLGSDKWGNRWFAKIIENGKQLWARERGSYIIDAGMNKVSKKYNPVTGLCKLLPKGKK